MAVETNAPGADTDFWTLPIGMKGQTAGGPLRRAFDPAGVEWVELVEGSGRRCRVPMPPEVDEEPTDVR